MNLLFFARDIGPKSMMGPIEAAAALAGHDILDPEDKRNHRYADLIVLAAGSDDCAAEEAVIESDGTKVVVLEDVPYAARRIPNIKDVAAVIPACQYLMGQQRCLPDMVTQPLIPPHWKNLFEQVTDTSGNPSGDYGDVVLAMGGKDGQANNKLFEAVARAANMKGLKFAMSVHPKEDRSGPGVEQKRQELQRKRNHFPLDCAPFGIMTQVFAVAFSDASTLTIAGAYARCNMLFYQTSDVVRKLENLGCPNGQWPVASLGAMAMFEDWEELWNIFGQDGTFRDCRLMQENFYPIPESWDTANQYLEELVKISASL